MVRLAYYWDSDGAVVQTQQELSETAEPEVERIPFAAETRLPVRWLGSPNSGQMGSWMFLVFPVMREIAIPC